MLVDSTRSKRSNTPCVTICLQNSGSRYVDFSFPCGKCYSRLLVVWPDGTWTLQLLLSLSLLSLRRFWRHWKWRISCCNGMCRRRFVRSWSVLLYWSPMCLCGSCALSVRASRRSSAYVSDRRVTKISVITTDGPTVLPRYVVPCVCMCVPIQCAHNVALTCMYSLEHYPHLNLSAFYVVKTCRVGLSFWIVPSVHTFLKSLRALVKEHKDHCFFLISPARMHTVAALTHHASPPRSFEHGVTDAAIAHRFSATIDVH